MAVSEVCQEYGLETPMVSELPAYRFLPCWSQHVYPIEKQNADVYCIKVIHSQGVQKGAQEWRNMCTLPDPLDLDICWCIWNFELWIPRTEKAAFLFPFFYVAFFYTNFAFWSPTLMYVGQQINAASHTIIYLHLYRWSNAPASSSNFVRWSYLYREWELALHNYLFHTLCA